MKCDSDSRWDERRCLFLTFNNSKFTGGTMMIAPKADPCDGYIEYVRWGPIGRMGLIRMLPRLYDGTHTEHELSETRRVKRVEFALEGPVDVMVDGEIITVTGCDHRGGDVNNIKFFCVNPVVASVAGGAIITRSGCATRAVIGALGL